VIERRTSLTIPHPAAATTMREVNNLAFLYRDRARFRAGESELLGVRLEPVPGDGIVVDVCELPELRLVRFAPNGAATIGAFTTPAALAAALPARFPADAKVANQRMRLALYDGRVTIYGLGRTRTAALERVALAPHELPVAIEIAPPARGLGIAERRRTTNDGDASYSVGVTVALRVSLLARFEHVRIFVDVDGDVRRAAQAEATLEGRRCDRDLFPEVARLAAASIPSGDARTSAMARSVQALAIGAVREAFAAARERVTER
jgi:CO/xanthine dehydrogenase FAD-binding subunit